ncbi:MAG: helix-turn-helix domain-containing protein [Tannerellaceae bacterium]|nr:helix-turn-helix domain-containing protein [Tannerellaceae bacterium]
MEITEEEKKYLIELGNQVRDLRHSKAWTQKTLGKKAGMNRGYISDIERGARNVAFLTLVKLAETLNCDVAAFTQNIPINKERIKNPKIH